MAWQTPVADLGKADWEVALVETVSNLSKQKQSLGVGFDPLLLNGMYDQGMVRQHVSTAQLNGGCASSVALPGPREGNTYYSFLFFLYLLLFLLQVSIHVFIS